jgi:hypothetical protein
MTATYRLKLKHQNEILQRARDVLSLKLLLQGDKQVSWGLGNRRILDNLGRCLGNSITELFTHLGSSHGDARRDNKMVNRFDGAIDYGVSQKGLTNLTFRTIESSKSSGGSYGRLGPNEKEAKDKNKGKEHLNQLCF